jgi:DNA-binding transcriptional MerR regulator
MKRLFIGHIAKRFGLNPRTIRFYESIGILPEAIRTEAGYRTYTDETVGLLEFILKAKGMGLKLNEIKEILQLHKGGKAPCDYTRDFIAHKIREIGEKINNLKELKTSLEKTLKAPAPQMKAFPSICPIIENYKKSA